MGEFRELSRVSDHAGPLEQEEMENILKKNIFGVFSCITQLGYPMTVPVHYVYVDGCVYIHTSNRGEKYDSILQNPKASFMVSQKRDTEAADIDTIYDTVLIYGTVDILDPSSDPDARKSLKEMAVKCEQPHKAADQFIDSLIGKYVVMKLNADHMSGRFLRVV